MEPIKPISPTDIVMTQKAFSKYITNHFHGIKPSDPATTKMVVHNDLENAIAQVATNQHLFSYYDNSSQALTDAIHNVIRAAITDNGINFYNEPAFPQYYNEQPADPQRFVYLNDGIPEERFGRQDIENLIHQLTYLPTPLPDREKSKPKPNTILAQQADKLFNIVAQVYLSGVKLGKSSVEDLFETENDKKNIEKYRAQIEAILRNKK